MAGKDLKIDLLPVNSVVKTSQMQDAVHRGVLDGCHYVPAYWYSKSKTASLFGTGPCFVWSSQEVLGWCHYGGGMVSMNSWFIRTEHRFVLQQPDASAANKLVQRRDQKRFTNEWTEVPYGWLSGRRTHGNGYVVVQLLGGEIQPAMKSGLIDAAEFNNPTSDRDFEK